MPSKVTYTSPVLFTPKFNNGWRFYVDYYKLNRITEKDKYLLPLIDKIFHHIIRVKVFTKLNIRYVFYHICMHLNSEELTAFGMYYGVY